MAGAPLKADTDPDQRLGTLIKLACWLALTMMTIMTIASFVLLQRTIAEQRRNSELHQLAMEQTTLSQRLVLLAVSSNDRRNQTKLLVDSLRSNAKRFESNYDRLLALASKQADGSLSSLSSTFSSVFYQSPYYLDYFSSQLASNSRRLASALEEILTGGPVLSDYIATSGRANLEQTVADATLIGYETLSKKLDQFSEDRQVDLLSLHRRIFYSTLGVIALIAILVFRPMTRMIGRRTRQLIKAHDDMTFAAEHDALTGLFNRGFIVANFDRLLADSRQRGEPLAVLQLDLDRFKQVNDTFGHLVGDHVLVRTAERLRAASRSEDICVRLGGDEFVVLARVGNGRASAEAIANRFLDRINRPISFQGVTVHPQATIGIAMFPDDAGSDEELLVHADLALYAAKRMGGGKIEFFTSELREDLDYQKAFAQDIRVAIESEAFCVYFQPQIDLVTQKVEGIEALVRWEHPQRGMISPAIFLPVAERSGSLAEIGRIVMRKAIAQAAEWHHNHLDFGRLSLNASGAELRDPDFETFVYSTLAISGLPTSMVSLEIVESVILDDERIGLNTKLPRLRKSGVHLELDDFGTGYASLSHIDPDQIDRVKIDRRFVHDIDKHPSNCKIVRAMIGLAQSLDIRVVAEGAETQSELDKLQEVGCTVVQGYGVAYPMSGPDATVWLQQQAKKAAQSAAVSTSKAATN